MSQKAKPWGSATNEQISHYIDGMLPGMRCDVCAGHDFQIESVSSEPTTEYLPYHVVTELGPSKPYYMFGVVPVTCLKCGHITFFSFASLARKINGRPA